MRDKNFYDYGFFEEYTKAVTDGNIAKKTEMEHKCYEQYLDVAHKMKWDLINRLKKTPASADTIYDMTCRYEEEIYPELIKAMGCVKMNKIPKRMNKKGKYTWSFYAAFWGYLSVYNRDTVAHFIKRETNEIKTDYRTEFDTDNNFSKMITFEAAKNASLNSEKLETHSPEKLFEESSKKKAFWHAVDICVNKKFNATQKAIWNLRKDSEKRVPNNVICKTLNIKPSTFNTEIKTMREILDKEILKAENIYC